MENANSRHTQIPCPLAVARLLDCLAMTTASTLNCFLSFSLSPSHVSAPHGAQSLLYYSILDATRTIGLRYSSHDNNRHNCHSVLYPPWNTHILTHTRHTDGMNFVFATNSDIQTVSVGWSTMPPTATATTASSTERWTHLPCDAIRLYRLAYLSAVHLITALRAVWFLPSAN